jgi:hypothetical protein
MLERNNSMNIDELRRVLLRVGMPAQLPIAYYLPQRFS